MSKISIYEVVPVPKLADKLVGTSVGGDPEDITYNFTLSELLNLFIPNIPGNTLQGVLDFGNTATQNINLTGIITTTTLNVGSTANILNSNLTGQTHITGGLYDRLNSIGTAGQVLTSTGTQVEWYTIPTVIPDLQQVLTSGNTAVNNIILTGNLSANNAALLTSTISTSLTLLGTLRDGLSSVGANNQVLSSNVTGVRWVNLPVYSATSPLLYNSGTGVFSIQQSSASQDGYLSSADWITFDGKQTAITLTTTGNSGASTLVGSTINVPNYTLSGLGGVPQTRTLTINGVTYNLAADRSWTIASGVGSVTATSPLFSTGGAFPDISIQIATASQNGYLSSGDWNIFNAKQPAGNYITSLTGEATGAGPGAAAVILSNAAVIGKLLTGLSITGSAITSSDSILTAFGKVQNQINGLIGGVQFQGVWNAATNTPALVSSVGTQGYYYIVDVAGNTNLNGITDWQIGDWAIFNGSTWNKVDNTDLVTSVNGQIGAVSLTTDNIPEGATNLYYLDSRARAALSFAAGSGAYNSTTGVITIPTDNNQILNGAGYITLVSLSATSPLSYNNLTGAFAIQVANTTQDGYLSSTDWNTFNGKQDYLNGTGLVKSVAGVISYITDNSANWNTAYNDSIVSAAVTGTATKTLTLNQQDGGTITASWSDIDTGLTSVGVSMPSAFSVANSPLTSNGTIAVTGSGNTLQYIDGTGALQTFPGLTGFVPYTGANQNVDLGAYGLFGAAIVIGQTSTQGYIHFKTGGPTALSADTSQAPYGTNGMIYSFDQTGGNYKQFVLDSSLLTDNTIRTYSMPNASGTLALVGGSGVGTVTSVSFTLGGTGTDLNSSVTNSTTTPAITLNVPTASAANRGALSAADWSTFNTKVGGVTATSPLFSSGGSTPNLTIQQSSGSQAGFLSSTDWTTFNNKQAAGNYITSLTGEATATGPGAAAVTLDNAAVTGKILTGVNITGGTILSTDSILTGFGKLQNQVNGLIGGSIYQGTWNASTNTPTLTSSVGTAGYYYIVSVAGNTNLNGITDWQVGDWAIFNGGVWQKVDNTDSVISVNGQTGAVSLTTDNISEGVTNLYFTNTRARAALSFVAGSGAYNSSTGAITIPTNTSQLTNGANFITLASLSGTAPISYNNGTGAISITQAGTASNGYLSSTDWNTFNNKQATLSLTTTGTSGAATLVGATLNIPIYQAAGTYVNSVTASAPLSSSGGVNPNITISQSSGSTNGFLSSTDWTTFNNKQATITLTTTGSSGAATLVGATLNIPNYGSALSGYLPLTGGALTGPLTSSSNAIFKYASGFALMLDSASSTEENDLRFAKGGVEYGAIQTSGSTGDFELYVNTDGTSGGWNKSIVLKKDATKIDFFISNAVNTTINSSGITSVAFIKSGGTSSQYLMADGSTSTLTNPVTGTGTTNYLPKFTGASTIGNSQIFDNGTNVGIGTATPSQLLHLETTLAGSSGVGTAIQITSGGAGGDQAWIGVNKGTGNGLEISVENRDIIFNTGTTTPFGGTERMRLTSSGNLGLGVTPYNWGSTQKAIDINVASLMGSGLNTYLTSNAYFNSGWYYKVSYQASFYAQEEGSHKWNTAPSGTAGNAISFTQAMTLNASGNLSVGTTTDAGYKLDVNGTGRFSGVLYANNSLSTTWVDTNRGAGNWRLIPSSGANFFYIQNSTTPYDEIVIDGINHRVGIGNSNPSYTLDVNGTGRFAASYTASGTVAIETWQRTGGAVSADMTYNDANTSMNFGTSTAHSLNIKTNNTTALTLASTGAATFSSSVTATSGVFGNSGAGSYSLRIANNDQSNVRLNIVNSGSGGQEFSIIGGLAGASNAGFSIYDNTNAATRLYITSGGNVGIGTTSPNALLDVYTSQGGSNIAATHGTGGSYPKASGISFGATSTSLSVSNNGGTTVFTGGAGIYAANSAASNNPTDLVFWTTSAGSPTERMRITSGGAVGIGTTNSTGLAGSCVYIRATSSNVGQTAISIQDYLERNRWVINGQDGTNDFSFNIYSTPSASNDFTRRFKISQSGIFSFNNASESYTYNFTGGSIWIDGGQGSSSSVGYNSWNTITFNDQFNDVARGPNKIITYGRDSSWVAGIGIHNDTQAYYAGGTHKWYKFNGTTATLNLSLDGSGNLTATGSMTATSFFESSDSRLKTIIEDNYQVKGIENVVAKLYTKNGKTELGYFAQDIEGLLENAINRGEDGYLNLSYREVHTAKIASLEARVKELELQLKQK